MNAEDVGIEKMKIYAESQSQNDPRWWFANTDVPAFNDWAEKNLGYARFRKAEGEEALLMKIQHDMGIVVIDRKGVMSNKEDIFSAGIRRDGISEEHTQGYKDLIQAQLMASVRRTLTGEVGEEIKESKTHIYLAIAAGILFAFISGSIVSSLVRKPKKES